MSIDPDLLAQILAASGYPTAADALRREVEGAREPDLAAKVAALEGRLTAAEARTATADARARASGQEQLDAMREAKIGPWAWHEGGSGDAA